MHSNTVDFLIPKSVFTVVALAASLASPMSQAQQVYRIVGPGGKVTFSDKPPQVGSNAKISDTMSSGTPNASGLPFELKQAVQKYPVTLYTGEDCGPCNAARSLLRNRGIPFSEKTVTTAQDSQALQRLSGETSLPFMTIGSQQLKGFSDAEWTQFLNAAGYPATSVLPPSYRQPAATPLVASASATEPAAAPGAAPKKPAARPVQPPTNNENPSGIRF